MDDQAEAPEARIGQSEGSEDGGICCPCFVGHGGGGRRFGYVEEMERSNDGKVRRDD